MKKLVIFLLFNACTIFGQDIIDPRALTLHIPDTTTSVFHTQFDGFVRGWNGWWISGKLGDALDINFYETKGDTESTYNYGHNI